MAKTAEQRVGSAKPAPKGISGEAIAEASSNSSMAVGLGIAARGGWVGLTAFGAGMAGGYAGTKLAEYVHADELAAKGFEKLGMKRIGQGGPRPARVGDPVAHSYAFAGFLATIVVGAVAAIAVGALIVVTGGAAAVAVIGAAAAGGFAGGFVGGALSGALSKMGTRTGAIKTGSHNVFINSMQVARVTDVAACSKEPAPVPLIEGSETVFVNSLPMARVGHKLMCGAVVDGGSHNVNIDNTITAIAQPEPEIPVWARVAADWLGFLPMGKTAAWMGRKVAQAKSAVTKGKPGCRNKTCDKDPVDVATGEFVDWRTDLHIPGPLPLTLKRSYASNQETPMQSLFGPRWTDSFSICLVRATEETIDYWDEEGVCLVFYTPHAHRLNAAHRQAPHLLLQGTIEQPVLLDKRTGTRSHFRWHGAQARLAKIEDAYGSQWEFHYVDGALSCITHNHGYSIECEWRDGESDGAGAARFARFLLNEPDQEPIELVRYSFDGLQRLLSCQSETSGRLYYRYDDKHRIVRWGDASHTHVDIAYDDSGRVAEVSTPQGIHGGTLRYDTANRITYVGTVGDERPTEYHYNEADLVTRIVNRLGHVTETVWNQHRQKTKEIDTKGQSTAYIYDDDGLLIGVIDARQRKSQFAYDDHARLTSHTGIDGRSQQWTYDRGGNVAQHIDADSCPTDYRYDGDGRRTRAVYADGSSVTWLYDDRGNSCGFIAPNDARTVWREDRLGRRHQETDALGSTTRYHYNDNGNLSGAPSYNGHAAPTAIELPTGEVYRYGYDHEGMLHRYTDAAGYAQSYEWGPYDLLMAHIDAKGHRTQYRYDQEARLTCITNAHNETWEFRYNAAGQLVQESDFAQRRTDYQYDAHGRLIRKTVADWLQTRYHWDDAERLSKVETHDCFIAYRYDELDRLIEATRHRGDDTESTLTWRYDASGRIVQTTQDGKAIEWAYDRFGQCVSRQTPVGKTTQTHDVLGLLKHLHTDAGDVFIGRDIHGIVALMQRYWR